MKLFIIIDWQNEEDITVLKDKEGETLRFKDYSSAFKATCKELNETDNLYLQITEII